MGERPGPRRRYGVARRIAKRREDARVPGPSSRPLAPPPPLSVGARPRVASRSPLGPIAVPTGLRANEAEATLLGHKIDAPRSRCALVPERELDLSSASPARLVEERIDRHRDGCHTIDILLY